MIARRDIARGGSLQHLGADRIAGMDALDPLRQFRGPGATGDGIDPLCEQLVHTPQHAVLFVDHARQAQGRSGAQSGN